MSIPSILLPGDTVPYDSDRTATVIASQWGCDSPEDAGDWARSRATLARQGAIDVHAREKPEAEQ